MSAKRQVRFLRVGWWEAGGAMIQQLIAFKTWGIGAFAAVSLVSEAASITYDISISAPCLPATCSGNVIASGTLQVAGLGAVTDPSQIVNYDLVLLSDRTQPFSLTSTNSSFVIESGAEFVATASSLSFRYSDPVNGGGSRILGVTPQSSGQIQFLPPSSSGLLVSSSAPRTLAQGRLSFPSSQPFTIGVTAVPLPAALPLLLGGFALLPLAARRRRA